MVMRRHILLLLLFAAAATISCRRPSVQMPLLMEAESHLPADVRSADSILKLVKPQELHAGDERSLYALLLTLSDGLRGSFQVPWYIAHNAYSYYTQLSQAGHTGTSTTKRRYIQAAIYMGDWYAAHDSIKACEDCYRAAIDCAAGCSNHHYHYIALQRLAEQRQWTDELEAVRLIQQALTTYESHPDKVTNLLALYASAAKCYLGAACCHDTTYYTAAIDYAHRELDMAVGHGLPEYESEALSMLAEIYTARGEHKRALNYARLLPTNSLTTDLELDFNRTLATCYLQCDSLPQAKALLVRPVHIKTKRMAYLYTRSLAEVTMKMGEYDSARCYQDSACTLAEEMYLDALRAKDDYYRKVLQQEQEATTMRGRALRRQASMWVLLFAILFFCVILSRRIYRAWQRQTERWRAALRQQRSAIHHHRDQMHQQALQTSLLQERQQQLLEHAKERDALIKHLQSYILNRNAIVKKLHGKTRLTTSEWADIEALINEIDYNSIAKLRRSKPSFTEDDIRLCVLTHIGFSNATIGELFCITPSAVQHRKLTLKKTGFGITDPRIALSDVLNSL